MDTNTSVGDRKMPGRAYGISSDLCMAEDQWINGSGEDVQTVKQCMYPEVGKVTLKSKGDEALSDESI